MIDLHKNTKSDWWTVSNMVSITNMYDWWMCIVCMLTYLYSFKRQWHRPVFSNQGGKGGRQDIFFGGEDPQKVISVDHFAQENAIFFLISLKVRGEARYFTGGNCLPKFLRSYVTVRGYMFRFCHILFSTLHWGPCHPKSINFERNGFTLTAMTCMMMHHKFTTQIKAMLADTAGWIYSP